MIRIFGKERKELHSDINTWIVKWVTYEYKFSDYTHPYVKECYKAFTNRDEADEYAKALNDSMTLLCITALPKAKVYKQEVNSV
jgi:hypothetical protein